MHQGMAALSPRPHWGNPPPSTTRAAEYLYIHSDHLNTPQVVTDQNQQVVWKGDYKPFGEVTETVSNIEFNLRFAGQYQDDETGLSYNWNRSYNPATGRYTQTDPIGLHGGVNLFAYAANLPTLLVDPTGLFITGEWITRPHITDLSAGVPQFHGYDIGDPSLLPPGIRAYYLHVPVEGRLRYSVRCQEIPGSEEACYADREYEWTIDGNVHLSDTVKVPVRLSIGPWWLKAAGIVDEAITAAEINFRALAEVYAQSPTALCIMSRQR